MPKLQICETFTAASKTKCLVILRILEIRGKLWLKWVKNVVSCRILTFCRYITSAERSYSESNR